MTEARHKEWILETIDHLKKRKNRPDLERICIVLMRKYGLSFDHVVSDLETLVAEKAVLKVNFNGQVSYRNAVKLKNWTAASVEELTPRVLESFIKMVKGENDEFTSEQQKAVSIRDLENWLIENDTAVIDSSSCKNIAAAVNKLVDDGKLTETESGLYEVNLEEVLGYGNEEELHMEVAKEKHEKAKNIKSGTKHKKSASAHAESKDFTTSENVPRAESKTPSPGNKKGRPPTKRKVNINNCISGSSCLYILQI